MKPEFSDGWRWLRRPKWLLISFGALVFLAWILWPVMIFVRCPGYPGHVVSRTPPVHFKGKMSASLEDTPSVAAGSYRSWKGATWESVPDIGDEAAWKIFEPHRAMEFGFRTGNVVWKIEAKGNDRGDRRTGQLKLGIEKFAEKFVRSIESGKAEGGWRERLPRGYLWLRRKIPVWRTSVGF